MTLAAIVLWLIGLILSAFAAKVQSIAFLVELYIFRNENRILYGGVLGEVDLGLGPQFPNSSKPNMQRRQYLLLISFQNVHRHECGRDHRGFLNVFHHENTPI